VNHEVLDGLYAARRELTRIIVATATQTVPGDALQQLLQQRDHIVWTINRILVSDLTSSLADIVKLSEAIEDSTKQLKALTSTAEDVAKAINIASQVLGAAAGLV
jgi:hypothetical protein